MNTVIQNLTSDAMSKLMKQKEDAIAQVLNDLAPGWILADIKSRCWINRQPVSGIETLYLDGAPVLEWHPLEVGELELRGDSYVSTVTQKYRRLSGSARGSQ